MKNVPGGGTEPRVSFSETGEGARKQGEAAWTDGVGVSAYVFLPPTQCHNSAVQHAEGIPELGSKVRIVPESLQM